MNMKKYLLPFIASLFLSINALADEGMWLPQLLEALNEKEMKKMGMKISASDIYNINKSSLKDAIVSFGGFCTGEVISDKGLLLTNHHCGLDAIQNHSSLQNNYLKNGFWAASGKDELVNPGLTATFIIRIDDVTAAALNGVNSNMSEKERQSTIDKNLAAIKETAKKESWQGTLVKPFFEGNKYFLFVTETFKDVRLVGAPPSSIGNFGRDTDNWMWPRHTGDFSMFRIYAGKDNRPADYSPDNVPYTPKRSLKISLDGVKEGDFTMVFGFPGTTKEYLHSSAVEQILKVSNPAKIAIREKVLDVMGDFMRLDEQIRIQYTDKYSKVENAYKKMKGEILGLTISKGVEKKKKEEAAFQKIVSGNVALKEKYGDLLEKIASTYAAFEPHGFARDYYTEIIPRIELFTIAGHFKTVMAASQKDEKSYNTALTSANKKLADLFAEYNSVVDKKLFEVLMEMYVTGQKEADISPLFKAMLQKYNGSYTALTNALYHNSVFTNKEKVLQILSNTADNNNGFADDSAYILFNDIYTVYHSNTTPRLNELQTEINKLQRTYMQAQMETFPKNTFYPDANSTLRVTYGNVKGYKPRDAVSYHFYTYLDGLMEKYKPGDYEFDVPQKLVDLYNKQDYGPYAVNGKLPVCFIAANHTTGGNSGSPALDANGNLIGLNFDRVWEGTMSDINYDKTICRNIMVDIRYVLFVVDKFAGAKHLVDEMQLVKKNVASKK
jgi:Peptidase S46